MAGNGRPQQFPVFPRLRCRRNLGVLTEPQERFNLIPKRKTLLPVRQKGTLSLHPSCPRRL